MSAKQTETTITFQTGERKWEGEGEGERKWEGGGGGAE